MTFPCVLWEGTVLTKGETFRARIVEITGRSPRDPESTRSRQLAIETLTARDAMGGVAWEPAAGAERVGVLIAALLELLPRA